MKRTILSVLILFVSITFYGQKGLSKNKKALLKSVEKHKTELIKISDEI
jgi:aminobenzoyl-glutamate utilization protein B